VDSLVTYTEALPKRGETVFGSSFQKSFGGKGANQAVQCARLGLHVAMAGMLGLDTYGGEYLTQFANEGVDFSYVSRSQTNGTGTASISVDKDGQNSIIIVQGANLDFSPAHVYQLEHAIKDANVVILQNEIALDSTRMALELCKSHGTISIFNPAPASLAVLPLVALSDIVCPNETELSTLTGLPADNDDEIRAAASHLLITGGCDVVLVTLGARGACLCHRSAATNTSDDASNAPATECHFFDTVKVKAVDTVGAGDSFLGTMHILFSFANLIALLIDSLCFLLSVSSHRYPQIGRFSGVQPSAPCGLSLCDPPRAPLRLSVGHQEGRAGLVPLPARTGEGTGTITITATATAT
jgi:ribokinase